MDDGIPAGVDRDLGLSLIVTTFHSRRPSNGQCPENVYAQGGHSMVSCGHWIVSAFHGDGFELRLSGF